MLSLRPHEENLSHKVRGNYFVKYDLSIPEKNKSMLFRSQAELNYYNYADFEYVTNKMRVKDLFTHILRIIFYRIKKLFRKN